jgi:hypothetical protein
VNVFIEQTEEYVEENTLFGERFEKVLGGRKLWDEQESCEK